MTHAHGHEPNPPADGSGAGGAASTEAEREQFWNELYRAKQRVWSGNPNAVLVTEASELEPGRALDLGSGEGGDAVWLAARGWRVTGVDISSEAIARAAGHARDAGVEIEWIRADLEGKLPVGPFNLVSAHFLQAPIALDRDGILSGAAATVAPGGILLVVSHAAFPPWSKHHDAGHRFPTVAETIASLDIDAAEWETLVAEDRPREATGPDGERATLVDAVVKLRRRAA